MKILKEVEYIENRFNEPVIVTSYEDNSSNTIEYSYDTKKEIATITFMRASKYLSGDSDELGIKPFYNIINQIVDLEVRATDIDTKDIILRPKSPEYEMHALLATKAMHNILNDMLFSETLNEYGETLTGYGNVLFKRTFDEKGDIKISIINWLNIVFDQYDIEKGSKIEYHSLTANDLENKRGFWNDEVINQAIEEIESSKNGKGRVINSVQIIEVEGYFNESIYTNTEREDLENNPVSLQHYFIYKKGAGNGVLFKEKLKSSNYIFDGRKKRLGLGWNLGVVEEGKESQIAVNLMKIYERRALEMKSLGLNVTDDPELEDMNSLLNKKRGDTIFVSPGKTFRPLDVSNVNTIEFENAKNSWQDNYKATLSAFNSVTGEQTTSGLSYRLGLLQAKQASSIFDYRREKKGIVIGQKIIKEWILPEIFKKINKDFILEAGFSTDELDTIQTRYATVIANEKLAEMIKKGVEIDNLTYKEMIQEIKDTLPKKETQFLDIKKGFFKNAEKHIRIDITGEEENVSAKMETLNTLIQLETQLGNKDNVEALKKEIIRLSGISGIDYGLENAPKAKQNNIAPEQAQVNSIKSNAQSNSKVLQ